MPYFFNLFFPILVFFFMFIFYPKLRVVANNSYVKILGSTTITTLFMHNLSRGNFRINFHFLILLLPILLVHCIGSENSK